MLVYTEAIAIVATGSQMNQQGLLDQGTIAMRAAQKMQQNQEDAEATEK